MNPTSRVPQTDELAFDVGVSAHIVGDSPQETGNISPTTGQSAPKVISRLHAVLLHIPFFSIRGVARLAKECDVAYSTMFRLVHGKMDPSLNQCHRIIKTLAKYSGKTFPIEEIFSADGNFPTDCVCDLMRCYGCTYPENNHLERPVLPVTDTTSCSPTESISASESSKTFANYWAR
jgi:DNA-binding XRE family transcriptional regulator